MRWRQYGASMWFSKLVKEGLRDLVEVVGQFETLTCNPSRRKMGFQLSARLNSVFFLLWRRLRTASMLS